MRLFTVLVTLPTYASVVYQYSGNTYTQIVEGDNYDTSMSMSGFIELENPLPLTAGALMVVTPLSFSINDGVKSYSNNDPSLLFQFQFATDASGIISEWDVFAGYDFTSPDPIGSSRQVIRTRNTPSQNSVFDQTFEQHCIDHNGTLGPTACTQVDVSLSQQAQILNNPGQWVVASTVPVPAAVWLFGSGLLGLVGVARRGTIV